MDFVSFSTKPTYLRMFLPCSRWAIFGMVLGCCIALISCKKDPNIPSVSVDPDPCEGVEPETIVTPVDAQLDAFDFGVGSYWVYRDTTSGTLDSLYLFDRHVGQCFAGRSDNNPCMVEITRRFESREYLLQRFPQLDSMAWVHGLTSVARCSLAAFSDCSSFQEIVVLADVIRPDEIVYEDVVVNGTLFADAMVYTTVVGANYYSGMQAGSVFYWHPDAGIVKQVLHDDQGNTRVLELIRYHIE